MKGKRDQLTLFTIVCVSACVLLIIVPATADTGTADATIATGPVIVDEQFSSSTLDPAWTFVQRSGRGRYSLTDNPGAFRYYGEGSCTGQALSWWDPAWSHNWPQGSYLLRTFAGDRWILRAPVTYGLHGISNGNSMGAQDPHLAIVFGEGTGPKVDIQRAVDYWYRRDVLNIHLQNAEGGDPMLFPDYVSPNTPIDFRAPEDVYHYTGSEGWINHTYWYEVVRDGREVTIGISTDGATYTPARSFTLPSTTAATQRIAFYLSEWAQVGSFIDIDKVTVQALGDPNSATVPGTIQAEDYDEGGEGVAYHDVDAENLGGSYRPADGVDIEDSLSADSLVIGYMRPGEWLEYTANVIQAGTYDITFRVASPYPGTSFRLAVDGTDAATVFVPNTGNWDTYSGVTQRVELPAGRHVLRITTGGYHNLDSMKFIYLGPTSMPTQIVTPTATPTATPTPPSPAPGWHMETVDAAGFAGHYTSLALDAAGNPRISYEGGEYDLMYTWFDGSAWHTYTVDSAGGVGLYASLALDGDGNPHISYHDLTNKDLKYATYDGTAWHVSTIDSAGDTGWYTSLVLDSAGNPRIGYYGNGDLKHARFDGSVWVIETVDSIGTMGYFPSLVLDAAGNPCISYAAGYPENDLRYATHDGTSWHIETVDSTENVGRFTSLKLDRMGNPHISYNDFNFPDNEHLKYAVYNGSAWQIETVGSMGTYGECTSLALDSADRPRIAYFDDTYDDLKYASNNGSSWDLQVVDSAGTVGHFASLALDGDGSPRISYGGNGDLKFAWIGTRPVLTPSPTPTPTPTPARPNYVSNRSLMVPGTVEAEDYDEGGEGITYHDTMIANEGGAYRTDGVDIMYDSNAGSLVIAYMRPSEWLQYTVNVTEEGTYAVAFRIASPKSGTSLNLAADGTSVATVAVPNTGAWDAYSDVISKVNLTRGVHVLRLSTSGYHNLDRLTFAISGATPTVTQTPTGTPTMPTLVIIPGGSGFPAATSGAVGLCNDVNGNGRRDFADVVLFFDQMSWIAANEPVGAFDYNDNGRIDFADAVRLFNTL